MTQTTPTPTMNAGLSVTTFGRATGYYDGEGLFGRGTFDAEGNFELDDSAAVSSKRSRPWSGQWRPAMNDETRQYVRRTTRTTATVRLFPYGGGWRVKYEKTSNSKVDSRLLAYHDEEYMPYPPFGHQFYRDGEYAEACRQARESAEKAYRQIVAILTPPERNHANVSA